MVVTNEAGHLELAAGQNAVVRLGQPPQLTTEAPAFAATAPTGDRLRPTLAVCQDPYLLDSHLEVAVLHTLHSTLEPDGSAPAPEPPIEPEPIVPDPEPVLPVEPDPEPNPEPIVPVDPEPSVPTPDPDPDPDPPSLGSLFMVVLEDGIAEGSSNDYEDDGWGATVRVLPI